MVKEKTEMNREQRTGEEEKIEKWLCWENKEKSRIWKQTFEMKKNNNDKKQNSTKE